MKSINGIFIPANDDQLSKIWETCAANNLPLDSSGVLSLLMAFIEESESDEEGDEEPIPEKLDPIAAVMNHFAANPEQAEALKQAGAKLFKNIFNKKG